MEYYSSEDKEKILGELADLMKDRSKRQAMRELKQKYGIARSTMMNWLAGLTLTKTTYDARGNVQSSTYGIRQPEKVNTEGMQVKKITSTPYGGSYVTFEKEQFDVSKLENTFLERISSYTGNYKPIDRTPTNDGHLLIVDFADIHIGKLASKTFGSDDYTIEIARQKVTEGLESLLKKATGFQIDKILVVIGNDALHIDTPRRTTTSGTPQDTDGTWYDAFVACHELYVHMIETLVSMADVHVIFNPSNHDYMSGGMLAKSIASWFRNCPNIHFDIDMKHRKYFTYGSSLIATSHGDGAKEVSLPQIMAHEAPQLWAETKYRYWYLHHIHHKVAKDMIGCTVEYLRSPSSADRWHSDNALISIPAVEGFIHSKENGQISRLTIYV